MLSVADVDVDQWVKFQLVTVVFVAPAKHKFSFSLDSDVPSTRNDVS